MSWSRNPGIARTTVERWLVHGTSGYDFLNQVGGLFVDGNHLDALSRAYHDFVQDNTAFSDLVYRNKLLIMQVSLSSELHMLTHQLDRLAQKSRRSRDFTFNALRYALREVIACFPVYRSYIDAAGASPTDRRDVEAAVRRAEFATRSCAALSFALFATCFWGFPGKPWRGRPGRTAAVSQANFSR